MHTPSTPTPLTVGKLLGLTIGLYRCARQRIILLSTKWTRKLDITKVNYLTKTRKGRGTKAW